MFCPEYSLKIILVFCKFSLGMFSQMEWTTAEHIVFFCKIWIILFQLSLIIFCLRFSKLFSLQKNIQEEVSSVSAVQLQNHSQPEVKYWAFMKVMSSGLWCDARFLSCISLCWHLVSEMYHFFFFFSFPLPHVQSSRWLWARCKGIQTLPHTKCNKVTRTLPSLCPDQL